MTCTGTDFGFLLIKSLNFVTITKTYQADTKEGEEEAT